MRKKHKKRNVKFCDPGMCDHCVYIGDGDFICDIPMTPTLVVADWQPTDEHLLCKRRTPKND